MIFDVRTYTLQPRMTKKYVGLFEQYAMPVAERHGFRLVGYFTSQIGELNQVLHIWAWNDLAELEAKRKVRDADPDWHDFLERTMGLIVSQKDNLMAGASFSPLK